MRIRPIVLLAALCTSTGLAGDTWPGFRGPGADGRADARNLVTTWSETENVIWKTPIHGRGHSSPVVLGKEVWVTTADEVKGEATKPPRRGDPPANPVKEVHFFAIGIDRDTGKVIHNLKLGTQSDPQYCHPFNTYASPTPYIEEGRLYAHFGSLGTWCVDTATGKVIWDRRDLKCDHFRGAGSSPVVYGNLLYLILDGSDLQYVIALDKTTGKTIWKTDRNIKYGTDNGDYKKAYATPALFRLGGKDHLVCPSAECTIAYDPGTGRELWRLVHDDRKSMNGSARPVMGDLGDGLLYLTSGNTKRLIALKPDGLEGMVGPAAVKWQATRDIPSRPSVLFDRGLIYMVSDDGLASCLDASTGKVHYSGQRLDGEFSASPVLAGGNIYYCSQKGKTFVVAAGTTFNVVAENRLGESRDIGFMASPAIAGDSLYLRTTTHLYRVGRK
jgi:outer membrane protein assembly factor BamB